MTQPEAALRFFEELRVTVAEHNHAEVIIDHTGLHKMSPEAALVLIAEMYRCHSAAPRCLKRCLLPDDVAIQNLLGQSGYYKYFKKAKWQERPELRGDFLEHKNGVQIEGEVVGKVIELFQPVAHLDDDRVASLYKAVGECMNNVLEHAYPKAERDPNAYRLWWLLAYRSKTASTISFCFYDQGEGIPRTIRTRFRDQLWLLAPSGAELIQRAVLVGGYSSTKRVSKGRGLPALRDFIETAPEGELVIFSQKSRVIFHTHQEPKLAEFSLPLHGSLITWNIRTGDGHGV